MTAKQTMDSLSPLIDVAVVGGSLAGCAAAIRFGQMGYRTVVFEKKAADEHYYKRLCTHFIQPSAVPILAGLGLAHLHDPRYSVRTKARFLTPGGVIDAPGGYLADTPESYALNLERRVLDPALRAAARQQGVRFYDGRSVERVVRDGDGWRLETNARTGPQRVRARLVVAADGRRSRLASLLGNPTEIHGNERAARFGYFSGIDAPRDDRSLFILNDRDMAFVYPLVEGRTLLSLYIEKPRAESWRHAESLNEEFVGYFGGLPGVPSLANAVAESALLG